MASAVGSRAANALEQSVTAHSAEHITFRREHLFVYGLLILGAVISLIPFLYMIGGSFKSYGSIINTVFWPWPPFGNEAPQWQNFGTAIQTVGWDRQWGTWLFVRYAANSTIVAFCTVTGVLVTSSLAAYAFAQMDVPGKNFLFMLVVATIMVPSDLSLVPKVVMMFQLHWYNTYPALIVPFTVSVFGIFLLRQFFLQIPRDLFDAARIDGAGHPRYLVSVVVPISYPAVVTIALFTFIWSWDEFKWPLLVTRDSSMRVLGVGLQQFLVSDGGTNTQLMMALATVVVLPVLAIFFVVQRHFTEAIISSSIKG
ncbi:MAG TPA: carbohydrate ABC transporter permease [Chloroflexota bacterium]|nr:carbohydrate ABC transporter permease [Chloroflexota bacterium]